MIGRRGRRLEQWRPTKKPGLPGSCLSKPMTRFIVRLSVGIAGLALVAGSEAGTVSLATVGTGFFLRANAKSETFGQAELFAGFDLPWRCESDTGWHVQTRLDLSAGALHGHSENAFVGTVGPDFVVRHDRFPVNLEFGVSPTILSRAEFGDMDFGIPFQFISHVGLNWEIGGHFGVGYRYQHMSNAGFSRHNPGLNLHGLMVYYRF